MNFYLPTKIITGSDVVVKNAGLFSDFGTRCIIVTGKSSAKVCGALDDVISALKSCNIEYCIYDKIMQNPEIACCAEGGAQAKEFGAEFVIGIGGGSPLDAAKAIAVLAVNDIDNKSLYSGSWDNAPLPVIAVGTTAGTGSEVTQVAVITDTDGKKKSFRHDKSFPALSFSDPKYLMHMPKSVMQATAIDALSHSLESYFIVSATELSRAAAVTSIAKICRAFEKIIEGAAPDTAMLEDVYEASLLGGYAISVTGTAFPHALGYFLSEDHGIPHGIACGIYLPEFIKYNMIHAKELSEALYKKVGTDANTLCDMIEKLLPKAEITVTDSEKDALMPRWTGHKCLAKMYGGADEKLLDSIIRKLF